MTDSAMELPLLTEVAEHFASDELPILFEIIPALDEPSEEKKTAPPRMLNAEEMQRLLQQLEIHLESVFTSKLNQQLEELQRLAVDMAVSEFKAELPGLLRTALKSSVENSK